jgi:hypothetical protein
LELLVLLLMNKRERERGNESVMVCACGCACARAFVLKLRGYCSAPKAITFSYSISILPSLTASPITSLPPLTACALFHLADLLRGGAFLQPASHAPPLVAVSRAPATAFHSFSVNIRVK